MTTQVRHTILYIRSVDKITKTPKHSSYYNSAKNTDIQHKYMYLNCIVDYFTYLLLFFFWSTCCMNCTYKYSHTDVIIVVIYSQAVRKAQREFFSGGIAGMVSD